METRQISKEEWSILKKKVISKMSIKTSILSIIAIAYTVFVTYCFITDISYLINTTAIQDASLTAKLMGIAFYVVYMIIMYISVKKIKNNILIIRHFYLDDYKAVDLISDDFKEGYTGKRATVSYSFASANPARIYFEEFLKSNN